MEDDITLCRLQPHVCMFDRDGLFQMLNGLEAVAGGTRFWPYLDPLADSSLLANNI